MTDSDPSGGLTLAKQGSITFIGKVTSRALGFLSIAIITRFVSPSTYGVFTLALAVASLTQQIASLSLNRAIDYFVPQHLSQGRNDRAKGVLLTVVLLSLSTTAVGAIVLVLAAGALGRVFESPALVTVLPVLAATLPLGALNSILGASFVATKRLKYRVYTDDFIRQIVLIVATVALLVSGFGLFGLVGGYAVAVFVTTVAASVFLVRNMDWVTSPGIERGSGLSLVSYSVPLAFAGVIYAVVSQIDYFVIGRFLDTAQVGYYRVAYSLASNLLIVLLSITPVFKPMIAEHKSTGTEFGSLYRLATRWAIMLTIPIATTLLLAPDLYLTLFFTPEYAVAGNVVIVLTLGYFLNTAFGPEGMVLEGLGYTRLTFINTLILITTNAVLDVLLVPRIGIVGAGIGTASAFTITGAIGVLEVYVLRGELPYSANVVKVLLSSVPSVVVGYAAVSLLPSMIVTALALPIVVTVTYVGTLAVGEVFTEDEIAVAERIDARLGRRIVTPLVSIRR